jgi:hypothetical protein
MPHRIAFRHRAGSPLCARTSAGNPHPYPSSRSTPPPSLEPARRRRRTRDTATGRCAPVRHAVARASVNPSKAGGAPVSLRTKPGLGY